MTTVQLLIFFFSLYLFFHFFIHIYFLLYPFICCFSMNPSTNYNKCWNWCVKTQTAGLSDVLICMIKSAIYVSSDHLLRNHQLRKYNHWHWQYGFWRIEFYHNLKFRHHYHANLNISIMSAQHCVHIQNYEL